MHYVIITVVILLIIYFALLPSSKEHFGIYKQYCNGCGYKNRRGCMNCTNCGYCITNEGRGECVPGDSNGPYFRYDCAQWEYGDPYYYYYPFRYMTPALSVRSVYPYYRWRENSRYGYYH